MTWFQAFILGLIQGLTEFIPVSSSGHLVLAGKFFDLSLPEATLIAFDILLHGGTLLALLIYFHRDFWEMIIELPSKKTDGTLCKIIIATIPAGVIGLLFKDTITEYCRNIPVVATLMIIVGVIFLLVEKKKTTSTEVTHRQAIWIGIAQSLALLPGVSRSGSTIVAGLFQGIQRQEAARFSFLLGTPLIAAATLLAVKDIFAGQATFPSAHVLVIGFLTSFVSSLLCVHFLLSFLRRHTLRVFAIYLFLVGGVSWGIVLFY